MEEGEGEGDSGGRYYHYRYYSWENTHISGDRRAAFNPANERELKSPEFGPQIRNSPGKRSYSARVA